MPRHPAIGGFACIDCSHHLHPHSQRGCDRVQYSRPTTGHEDYRKRFIKTASAYRWAPSHRPPGAPCQRIQIMTPSHRHPSDYQSSPAHNPHCPDPVQHDERAPPRSSCSLHARAAHPHSTTQSSMRARDPGLSAVRAGRLGDATISSTVPLRLQLIYTTQ